MAYLKTITSLIKTLVYAVIKLTVNHFCGCSVMLQVSVDQTRVTRCNVSSPRRDHTSSHIRTSDAIRCKVKLKKKTNEKQLKVL